FTMAKVAGSNGTREACDGTADGSTVGGLVDWVFDGLVGWLATVPAPAGTLPDPCRPDDSAYGTVTAVVTANTATAPAMPARCVRSRRSRARTASSVPAPLGASSACASNVSRTSSSKVIEDLPVFG